MGQCPLCGAQVSDDFGLIECSGCRAQLLVHMDGRVEHSGESGEVSTNPHHQAIDLFPSEEGGIGAEVEISEESPVHTDVMTPEPSPAEDPPSDFTPAPEPQVAQSLTPLPPAEWNPDGEEAPLAPMPAVTDSPDLSDIAEFGNSGASSSRDGSLRYNLFITGIDTADVRESFREAITDRKLVWDIDQILRSIKNGEVSIAAVPASKAYIVVSRLRNLPLQVRWEQYAIAQI